MSKFRKFENHHRSSTAELTKLIKNYKSIDKISPMREKTSALERPASAEIINTHKYTYESNHTTISLREAGFSGVKNGTTPIPPSAGNDCAILSQTSSVFALDFWQSVPTM